MMCRTAGAQGPKGDLRLPAESNEILQDHRAGDVNLCHNQVVTQFEIERC